MKLEKYCDKNKLIAIAESKDLTPIEIDLLVSKYAKGMTQAQLTARYFFSLSTIKRMLKNAKKKFDK